MRYFGLIGERLDYSFSKGYFAEKFEKENIPDCQYELYEIPSIELFPKLIKTNSFSGLNVTIPYKEVIIPYLDELDESAEEIGAVNTVAFEGNRLKGYNTDIIGFEESVMELIGNDKVEKALVLGTGGASKAIQYVLKKLDIKPCVVSRTKGDIRYEELSEEQLIESTLIINCTPLGTHPKIKESPPILYDHIGRKHLLYDLVYNPTTTRFMQHGIDHGSCVKNGLEMLHLQADRSWEIWNE